VSNAEDELRPVTAAEVEALFAGLEQASGLVLAVSGGSDSAALLWLVGAWRRDRTTGPPLLAVTIDHGLRPQAAAEAQAVSALAARLGVSHRILAWQGPKPATGLQAAARAARYRLLAQAASQCGADCILTAHTRDDQAETLLLRMARGSGLAGLGGMERIAPVPGMRDAGLRLVRPFLDVPKARLIATLDRAGIPYADDPSNRDPRFARARLRALMPQLAREGLDARRLVLLARRLKRADTALEAWTQVLWHDIAHDSDGEIVLAPRWCALPQDVRLRLLGRAIAAVGDEGPVELAKLEALEAALTAAATVARRLRRTLAGAVVTVAGRTLHIARAPARRRPARAGGRDSLNHGSAAMATPRAMPLE
jgi:tRNA(Ile)-lysidine synthase